MKNKKGFKLIELLIVVLIIDILAGVAIPHFQLSSDKAKYASMMSLVKAVKNEQEMFYQSNGRYATSWDELGTDILPKGFEIVDESGRHNIQAKYPQFFVSLVDGSYVYGHITNPKITYLLGLNKDNDMKGKIQCLAYGTAQQRARANKVCKSFSKAASSPYGSYEIWNIE